MYADDIIFFTKATSKDAHNINVMLEKYCSWFGQSINKSKSGVFFSKHTHPSHRRHIKEILQLKNLKETAMYLGAPLILSRSPSLDFSYLCEKSWAGEVSAYPGQARKSSSPLLHCLYLRMPCLLSTSLRRYVTKWMPLPEDFGGNKKRKKANSLLGSLGTNFVFQRLRVVLVSENSKTNNALLAKLAWMVASKWDSLCMQILRAKYKGDHSCLRSDPPKSASPIWKAVDKAKSIVIKGACYTIGDEASIYD